MWALSSKAIRAVGVASFHAGTLSRSRSLRSMGLRSMAERSLRRGRIEETVGYAEQMLAAARERPEDWNHGNLLHHGHLLLGRAAYERGELEEAEAELLAAAATPGSPQLDTFGPNMALAERLLARGCREGVLRYLEACRGFWESGGEELERWTREVREGRTPAFGANLDY